METVRRYRSQGKGRFYRKHRLLTWIFSLLAALLALLGVFFIWFKPLRVSDASMEPLLYQGEGVLADRLGKYVTKPGRGDVVLFADSAGNLLLKRIIALEGETVEIVGGKLFIDSCPIDESAYHPLPFEEDVEAVTVPQGNVYVLGDNRAYTRDSRMEEIGCVSYGDISAVLRLRIYPAGKLTFYY